MFRKKTLWIIVLLIYTITQILSATGTIQRNQVFAAENNQNTMTNLVAVLVDDKIYPQIETDLKRYTTQYIQKKYENSKALVLKINTSEYTAPEITKMLENLYFNWEKGTSSQLIWVIMVGEIPLPVLKYQDYIFPSVYPYVDFLEQKYTWNEHEGFFTQNKDSWQAEIWHWLINFKNDASKYHNFFSKLKTYSENPGEFVDKKIRYDDFLALQNNFLQEANSLYKNKIIFTEDLLYHRYTDLLFNTLQSDNTQENNEIISWLSDALKELWDNSNLSTSGLNNQTKTPTAFLKQKIESLTKDYISSISTEYQRTLNENIKASDRRSSTWADTHYKKLQLKDTLLLWDNETQWLLKSLNDKLETFIDQKVKQENYAMKSVIPTEYFSNKDYRKKFLVRKRYFPEFRDTYRFFYFWQDANTLENVEQSSIFRGTFRNLQKIWSYSSIISDPNNPAKTKNDQTNLTSKNLWASYDLFSTQVQANRAFNMLKTQEEYNLYQKEKTYAKVDYHCTKRRFGLNLKWKRVPCARVERKGIWKCNPNSSNQKDQADCENFQEFGNRVRGGATPLNITGISEQSPRIQSPYDPKSARKPIFNIAGSLALDKAETPATSFLGLKHYISPTKTQRKEWALTKPTEHIAAEPLDYFNLKLNNLNFNRLSNSSFSFHKTKSSKTDLELRYQYKIIDSTIKHTATTSDQINGGERAKYGQGTENYNNYLQLSSSLKTPNDTASAPLINAFSKIKTQLTSIRNSIQTSSTKSQVQKIRTDEERSDFSKLSSGLNNIFSEYNQIISQEISSNFTNTIENIKFKQIEKEPQLSLHKSQHDQILKNINTSKSFLTRQIPISENIFNGFITLDKLNKEIWTLINNKITSLENQINILRNNLTQNQTQIKNLVDLLWEREKLKTRSMIISQELSKVNEISECETNHETLGSLLGKQTDIISSPNANSAQCKIDNETEGSGSSNETANNHLKDQLALLEEWENIFKKTFSADPNNPSVKIEAINATTYDRPIDSPRYLSFQGIGGHEIKLIYPNLFKVEAFLQKGENLILKTPDQFKTAIQNYLKNKVNEYNTILIQEKNQALQDSPHFKYLKTIDPLATPSLNARKYQPFTYEELVSALWGEKMISTLAYLLAYHNAPVQSRSFSDQIMDDLKLTKSAFDINHKIEVILSDYLTQNSNWARDPQNISTLSIPTHTKKGYEVGFINSNDSDSISSENISTTTETSLSTNIISNNTNEDSPLSDQSQKDELECWFNYNDTLLLFDISKGNSPWLKGFQCRRKQIKKKPFELSLSRDDNSILSKLIKPEDPTNDNQLIATTTSPTPSFWPDKIIGTILEKISIKPSSTAITISEKSTTNLILTTPGTQTQNLSINFKSTGENCLLINGKNSCSSSVNVKWTATPAGWEIPLNLTTTKAWSFQTSVTVCSNIWSECGQKTYTFSALPNQIESFSINIGEKRQFAAGVYSLVNLNALDKYKNPISRSLTPYILTASKGGFILGGKSQKSIEINDFSNTNLIYRADSNDNGTVTFTVKSNQKGESNKILWQTQGTIVPAHLSLQYKDKNAKEIDYYLNTLPLYTKDKKVNENHALKIQIKLLDQSNQPIAITTRASLKTEKNLINLATLDQDKNWIKLMEDNNPILKNGQVDLYIIPKGIAGIETLSLSIPGLKEEKIKIRLHPGPLSKIEIKMDKDTAPVWTNIGWLITLTDQRGNTIEKEQTISLNLISKETKTKNITIKWGNQKISTSIPEWASQLQIQALIPGTQISTNAVLKSKKNFLSSAVENGLNVMYLNLFGSDRGNQRGYQSDFSSYAEKIISKSEKTLAITTQLIDLKKLGKPSLLLLTKGKIQNTDTLPLSASIENRKIKISLGTIWEISILSPLDKIVQTTNLQSSLLRATGNPLVITNLDENYQFKNQTLSSLQWNPLATLDNGLTFELTAEEDFWVSRWNMLLNWEAIADVYFPGMNFTLSQAKIKDPNYTFAPTFQSGSTNIRANALFNTSSNLADTYQGYDSIQNSDTLDKYIGFRGNFKNITNFAAGKTVGESTLPFGSEFLINIWDPLLERISTNTNIPNTNHNWGLEKTIYSDPNNEIFKVIDIDYNNDGLKDLLIVYRDGTVKLQKQYSDHSFKDLETLILTAQEIKEIYVWDLDGNNYQDILIHTSSNQLRAYLNQGGKFAVDGQLVCLNTNASKDSVNPQAQYLSGVSQFFLEDMNLDKASDLVTYDKRGDIKIFYANGKGDTHSFLSNNAYTCDTDRYNRQKNNINLVHNIGVQLSKDKITDKSIVRWAGLISPNAENLSNQSASENNQEIQNSIPAHIQKQLQNPDKNFNPKNIMDISKHFNANQYAGNTLANFEKYLSNPFEEQTLQNDGLSPQDQAFIQINNLDNSDLVEVYKTYQDLNWGNLIDGDQVKITVHLKAKTTKEISFLDTVEWPWKLKINQQGKIQNFKIEQGWDYQYHGQVGSYPYAISFIPNINKELVRSYTVNYHDLWNAYKIAVHDEDILDYQYSAKSPEVPSIIKKAPKDWETLDGYPDITISPTDWCFKQQSILFNSKQNAAKTYNLKSVNLQELSDRYTQDIAIEQKKNQEKVTEQATSAQTNGIDTIPGLSSIGEKIPTKEFLSSARKKALEGWSLDLGNIDVIGSALEALGIDSEKLEGNLDNIQSQITDIADKACKGFTFWDKNNSCKGLPIPFNQAFLGPGKYHIMWCIPLEPLTQTLGKGLPVFHFPGTLPTPVWPIPMPRGLKGPWDQFLRAPWGSYPSMIRIYAMPTLTAQLGLAICMGPYSAGINLPSPLSDIAGNCIVTSVALPCGAKKDWNSDSDSINTPLHSRSKAYGDTNSCNTKQGSSPFRSIQTTPKQEKSGLAKLLDNASAPEASSPVEMGLMGGLIRIDQEVSIVSEGENTIGGIQISAPNVTKNKILWGMEWGVMKILMWFLDNQLQYTKNNLLRREFNLYLPDLQKVGNQISSVTSAPNRAKENQKNQKIQKKLGSPLNLNEGLKNLFKSQGTGFSNTLKTLSPKKENLSQINLLNGDNLFAEMKTLFNQSEIVSVRTQDIFIKVPRIYGEDIEAYKNHLLIWKDTQWATLLAWKARIEQVYNTCPAALEKLKKSWDQAAFEKKAKECKLAQEAAQKVIKLTQDFNKISEQIRENIVILDKYKRFPLELYEYIHITEKYIAELSSVITNFFGYINYWMDLNATRFSQYVDAIITILAIVKTYQVIVDFSANRGKKCGTCTNDTYDQYTCKLSFLCSGISLDPLPIPNIKLPNLTVDLSHLDLWLDIVLPNFRFSPQSIDLIQIPNLPQPPAIGLNLDIDFEIPDLPVLPEPPTLPPLPSLIPKVKMSLPVLPPAPKIPELPKQITSVLNLATKLGQIYCIVKQGFGLVGESSVKAKVEQITQRSYNVPWVDNLDLGALIQSKLRKTNLKGVDYQVDSYVNLQYNFDQFYAFLKGVTDEINNTSTALTTLANKGVWSANNFSSNIEGEADNLVNQAQDYLKVDLNTTISFSNQQTEKNNTKSDLLTQLSQAKESLHSQTEKDRIQQVINLTQKNTTITANTPQTQKIKSELENIIAQHTENSLHLSDLIKKDYKQFLLTLDTHNQNQKPYQLTYSTSFLNKNPELQQLISKETPAQVYIQTEQKNVDGYLNALNTHTPTDLKMNQDSYDKSKTYLLAIKDKIHQFNSLQKTEYAGTLPLITKTAGSTSQKPLLTANSNQIPSKTTTSSDYSSYIKGVLIKTNDKQSNINVVNSEYNSEQFQGYYQQDMNNDKKSDLITRDTHTVWIKYADDAENKTKKHNNKYYLITPSLKKQWQTYESSQGSAFKLYDIYPEVKNFELKGQNFDALKFSRTHNSENAPDGYLIRISNRIDAQKEKFNADAYRYALFLPQSWVNTGSSLEYQENKKANITSLLNANFIYALRSYNPSSESLNFSISELPRERTYLQIASLKHSGNTYHIASPRSNQLLGGRQILWDTQPPKPNITLIRKTKKTIADQGAELNGYVGTYYDLRIERKDNVLVNNANIKENNKILTSKIINSQKWDILLENLFFTEPQTRYYEVSAVDSEGNEVSEQIALTIDSPLISIEDVSRFSWRKEWLKNPIQIDALLNTDIDRWTVTFQRERNQTLSDISALSGGKKLTNFPVSTHQTQVQWAYFDYGNLIGMFNQSGSLYGNIDSENGEITILPAYQNKLSLEVSFEKHYPIVNLMEGNKKLFQIVLRPEQLLSLEHKKGELVPLSSKRFGEYQWGKVLLIDQTPVLYIGPKGQLSSPQNLYASYQFNEKSQSVTYKIHLHRFGEEIASVQLKVKPM